MTGPVVVAVLSHRDPPLVTRLVERLLEGEHTLVLVHHDPRGPRLDLPDDPRISWVPDPQPCDWGGPGLARAALRVLQTARAQVADLSWLLLVSGQDYPARPVRDIERELEHSQVDAFLRSLRVDGDPADDVHRWQGIARRRYLRRIRVPGTSRSAPFPRRPPFSDALPLHVGGLWLTLSSRAVDHVLASAERHPEVVRYLLRCPIPDEALIPTLLRAGGEALRVEPDNRRYMRWTPRSPHPSALTEEDLPAIRTSNAFFVRKVDPRVSGGLLRSLDALESSA